MRIAGDHRNRAAPHRIDPERAHHDPGDHRRSSSSSSTCRHFDDLLKYTPNVTFSGNGPGQGNIFMRGLSSGGRRQPVVSRRRRRSRTSRCTSTTSRCSSRPATSTSTWPTWSASKCSRARRAPCSAAAPQAGAVRYITNKPKLERHRRRRRSRLRRHRRRRRRTPCGNATHQPAADRRQAGRARERSSPIIAAATSTTCPARSRTQPAPRSRTTASSGGQSNTNPVDLHRRARCRPVQVQRQTGTLLIQQNYQNMRGRRLLCPVSEQRRWWRRLGPDQITAFAPQYDKDRTRAPPGP